MLLISSILTYTKYLNFRCALPSDVFTGEEKKSMAYFFNITYKKDSENSCYWLNKYTKQIKYIVLRRHITWAIQIIFTSDRTLRSHFLYVCMSVCMSHNQIISLEDEKVNLIENSLLKNNWYFEELNWKWGVFYKVGFGGRGVYL